MTPTMKISRLMLAALAATLAAAALSLGWTAKAQASPENYDFESTSVSLSTLQAGGHPDVVTSFRLNGDPGQIDDSGQRKPWATLRDMSVEMPAGLTGNPKAFPTCDWVDFFEAPLKMSGLPADGCPVDSQVGTVAPGLTNTVPPGLLNFPLYNLESPGGDVVARLGFHAIVIPTVIEIRVDPERDNALTATMTNSSGAIPTTGADTTIWGVPTHTSHNQFRTNNLLEIMQCAKACTPKPSGLDRTAFMTNPTSCGPVEVTQGSRSYAETFATPVTELLGTITGCELLPFEPVSSFVPTSSRADDSSGMDVSIGFDQSSLVDPEGLAQSHLKKAVVTMPEGMSLNPSAADGLGSCSEAQIGLTSVSPIRFDAQDPSCPNSSKVGTAHITTPVLEEPLEGDLYVAEQNDNPFDSLLAGYMVAKGKGVIIKLAGNFERDPATGRITATFDNNPQQPFSELELHFKGGPRGVLATPPTCGTYQIQAELTPWSGGAPVTQLSSFVIDRGPDGGPCLAGNPAAPGSSANLASRPFAPSMSAGLSSPVAGGFTPFNLRLARPSGHQEILSTEISPPQGVLAKLAGVEQCSDPAANTGGCPAASRIGTTVVGAGAGATPFYIQGANAGQVYLTGPYDPDGAGSQPAAPLGMAIEVPAKAGPFDLGTVNVRAAVYVDPDTAELRVVSGNLPQILEGIPLRVRDIRVNIDRAGFTSAPTDCSPAHVRATVTSVHGAQAQLAERFQVAGCGDLDFAPRLGLRLTGRKQTRSGRHPGVRAVVRQSGVGEAGIARARVALPKSLALDPDNARALCEFTDGTKPDLENHCPAGSIVGRARAVTPLLDEPLVGNVYFVKNVRRDPRTGNEIRTLPMIVAALRGEIAINLRGNSSTTRKGLLVNTFAGVPDAPITRFNLNLRGGSNGILVVTETRRGTINLCRGKQTARTSWRGQNAKRSSYKVRVKTPCTKKQRRRAARARG